jgi:hypothetical protein
MDVVDIQHLFQTDHQTLQSQTEHISSRFIVMSLGPILVFYAPALYIFFKYQVGSSGIELHILQNQTAYKFVRKCFVRNSDFSHTFGPIEFVLVQRMFLLSSFKDRRVVGRSKCMKYDTFEFEEDKLKLKQFKPTN